MNANFGKPGYREFCAVAALALALSLGACDDKPAAAPVATKIELPAAVPVPQTSPAGAAALPKAVAPKPPVDAKLAADKALADRVKASIISQPGMKAMPMDVRAQGGAVTLYGTADSEEQRAQAEKIAAGVPGVTSVKNQLLILRGS